ncbi:MAG: hypothetical protein A2204_03430 [Elusimicrobia bacterium RIFOXYA1_FULL_47_7]|nr:MAG: hypothetical protein A2278_06825 [Elusimicrobia bacterium RIFOXYA12_FULL_49_49]OGS08666.1 MAG: hypothetical protein A2204_03430 [Elusimicrobia bacterium RIFOXYA1_FULL_47_7]OGS11518.1 MAG: hypothetical protein A2386_03985 [Elusimicrobia bacterium RIFOXYB1_FULL_48_9]OGS16317.1 MAG: hypothetical protein A2251_01360 [Elusimicrobia bacterium RIFOXYA2_FULL_47_53]OGS26239.1 MAG: hypothetical protein A2339_02735 [Elusimicrobia bacterium RIFOXYB12_FULL_50_12]OGS31471.1 MAG: hypothetical protein
MKKIDSKEVGLASAIIFGKYFFKTNDLHYGYWPDGLKVDISNITIAQENHSGLILSAIPPEVKSVLDVGCGAGSLASRLIAKGYSVDCVSPSSILTNEAKKLVDNKCEFFESTYEQVETDKKYDIVIFSESFQYIHLANAMQQTVKFLKPGGYMLICDFFKTDAVGESALGGGHDLKEFYSTVVKYPFQLQKDTDITKQTAPNLALIDDMLKQVGHPIWNMLFDFIHSRHPFLYGILLWKFKKKIAKINKKYFSGERNADNFARFKSYRLMLYKKTLQ